MDRLAQLATGRRSRWVDPRRVGHARPWASRRCRAPSSARRRTRATRSSLRPPSPRARRSSSSSASRRAPRSTRSSPTARAGGLTAEDRIRIEADAQAICALRARLSSVVRVITPYGLGLRVLENSLAPASPAVGPVTPEGDVALVTVQTTRRRARRSSSATSPRSARSSPTDAVVTGEAGVRRRPVGGLRGHRRDAAGDHRRADPGPAADRLPLADRGGRPARRSSRSPISWPRAWSTGSPRPARSTSRARRRRS